MKYSSITIARSLEAEDIRSNGAFDHVNVIDTRTTECGKTRPIEEGVLKRLKNHFIGYEQVALENDDDHLMGRVGAELGDTLVLTDDVAHLASICQQHWVDFKSKSFYVVETGKGDFVRSVPEMEPFEPRFGTFVG